MPRNWFPLCLLACCVAGCGPKQPTPLVGKLREYQYRHEEATGLTEVLTVKGRDFFVQYTPDSDKREVDSLLDQAQTGKVIVVVGELIPGVKRTQEGDMYPMPDNYQDFRLVQWREVKPGYVLRQPR